MNYYEYFIKRQSLFNTLNRVNYIEYLEPVTRMAVQSIMMDALGMGQPLMIFETYRSQARQELLYSRKATQLKTVGVHHYGLACDLVKDINGEPSWQGDFSFLGELAKKYHLVWGGDWPDLRDMAHVQRISIDDQPRLFNGEWYPDSDYKP